MLGGGDDEGGINVADQIELAAGQAAVGGESIDSGVEHDRIGAGSAVESWAEGDGFVDHHAVVARTAINLDSFGAGVIDGGVANEKLCPGNVNLIVATGTGDLEQIARSDLRAAVVVGAIDGDWVAVAQ